MVMTKLNAKECNNKLKMKKKSKTICRMNDGDDFDKEERNIGLVEGCDGIDNMSGGLGYIFLYSRWDIYIHIINNCIQQVFLQLSSIGSNIY